MKMVWTRDLSDSKPLVLEVPLTESRCPARSMLSTATREQELLYLEAELGRDLTTESVRFRSVNFVGQESSYGR
jgi:hypothetical protein